MAGALRAKTPDRRVHVIWICAFLVAITWLVFGQTLTHDFVNFDDKTYVYGNPVVTSGLSPRGIAWAFTHSHARNWHPLTTISHMLDCRLFGLKAGGHHFTNVLLHTIAAVLLFLLLCNMTDNIWRSAFVAGLFAIHPLHVESAAWIAERKDVLSAVFFILTLGAYVRYARKPTAARYITTLILFACGLMSKPMLVTVPFVLLLLDYWPLGRWGDRSQRSEVRGQKSEARRPGQAKIDRRKEVSRRSSVFGHLIFEKIPLFALSAISCVATLIAQSGAAGAMEPLPLAWRINNAAASYVIYIWQTLWPARLAAFYPASQLPLWKIVLAFTFLIATTAVAIGTRKKYPYVFTGWFWYLGMLVPVIGVFQIGLQGHADRYTYLPQIGLALLVTWDAADVLKTSNAQRPTPNVELRGDRSVFGVRRSAFGVFSVIVLLVLAWRSWNQAKFWQNSQTLWTHALAVTSNNDVAHNNLGLFFAGRGQLDDAISQYESALKIRSGSEEARYNLSNALVHNNLANALVQRGRLDEAIAHYKKAVELRPDYADGHFNFGSALIRDGQADAAIAEWQKALAIQPNDAEAHITLGDAQLLKGEASEAVVHYERAVEISPGSILALNKVAWVLSTCPDASVRNGARAVELAQRADQLTGDDNPLVIRTLAAAYAENGRFGDAIQAAQRGAQLARIQGNMALAGELEKDLHLYRTNIPLRRSGPPTTGD